MLQLPAARETYYYTTNSSSYNTTVGGKILYINIQGSDGSKGITWKEVNMQWMDTDSLSYNLSGETGKSNFIRMTGI